MYCPVDRTWNKDTASYCRRCGKYIRGILLIKPPSSTPAQSNNTSPVTIPSTSPQPQQADMRVDPSQPLPLMNILTIFRGRIKKLQEKADDDDIEVIEREIVTLWSALDNLLRTYIVSASIQAAVYQHQDDLSLLGRKISQRKRFAVKEQNQFWMNLDSLDKHTEFLYDLASIGDIPMLQGSLQQYNFRLETLANKVSSSTTLCSREDRDQLKQVMARILAITGILGRRQLEEQAEKRNNWRGVLKLAGETVTLASSLLGLGAALNGRKIF